MLRVIQLIGMAAAAGVILGSTPAPALDTVSAREYLLSPQIKTNELAWNISASSVTGSSAPFRYTISVMCAIRDTSGGKVVYEKRARINDQPNLKTSPSVELSGGVLRPLSGELEEWSICPLYNTSQFGTPPELIGKGQTWKYSTSSNGITNQFEPVGSGTMEVVSIDRIRRQIVLKAVFRGAGWLSHDDRRDYIDEKETISMTIAAGGIITELHSQIAGTIAVGGYPKETRNISTTTRLLTEIK